MRPTNIAWLFGFMVAASSGCHGKACDTGDQCDVSDGSTTHDGAMHADAAMSGKSCPSVTLGTTLPLSYQGNNTGKANLVTSARLEWGDAPDDALLFVAPQAGTYTLGLASEPSMNGGCGASAADFNSMVPYTETSCPAMGTVGTLDGIYSATGGTTSDFMLTQGQHLLIWVSCTTWSSAKTGPYTLTITKK